MRNVFKFGDAFFIRDPETKKLFHVDPAKVSKIIVNESTGKTPEQYVIRDINFNFKSLVATTPYQTTGNVTGGGSGYLTGGVRGMVGANYQDSPGTRFATGQRNAGRRKNKKISSKFQQIDRHQYTDGKCFCGKYQSRWTDCDRQNTDTRVFRKYKQRILSNYN